MLTGSSQLTRGTLGGSDIRAGLCRFIPACAGNSYERKKVTEYTSVHPRLRGELGPHIRSRIGFIGSSPLTRGTPPDKVLRRRSLTVHPRLRGELERSLINQGVSTGGSSPLTRGTQAPEVVPDAILSGSSPLTRGTLEDNSDLDRLHAGSSPLTRGTHCTGYRWLDLTQRFIPAYAGNSTDDALLGSAPYRFIPAYAGNSLLSDCFCYWRFIPAYAGNSAGNMSAPAEGLGSSPLTRGTQIALDNVALYGCGSSPLTRGTLIL